MVVVDTSVWIRFLRQPQAETSGDLRQLLRRNRAAITGVILAEVLQGGRGEEEFRLLRETLDGVPYLDLGKEVWIRAGAISAELRREGNPLPLTDISIAAAAIEGDHELFSLDPDFERIPGLRVYKTKGGADA
jgi:predicted nucleic acid-binding protein